MKAPLESKIRLNVFDTRNEMGKAAGKAVEEKIIELLSEKEEIRMIFAAAPSQSEFFEYLGNSSKIPWDKIIAFHMDEYIGLEKSSDALFANFLERAIFGKVKFKEIHLIDGLNDPEDEMVRYANLISEKPIDIVCLGIGENGHIAFNDPHVADFNDPELIKKVSLDLASRMQQVHDACFPTLEEVPTEALTLTIPTLMNGNFLFCIVPGSQKREAVKNALHGPLTEKTPASILRNHDNCELYVDRDAYPLPEPLLVKGINCLNGKAQALKIKEGLINELTDLPNDADGLPLIGPGLVDIQINGINGIDFNDPNLTEEGMLSATEYLLSQGITGYLPTLITNSDEHVHRILSTIKSACEKYPLVNACVIGVHLEGPFLSAIDGARGAHSEAYIREPSWELVNEFQNTSGQRIRLVTMAPEWENAPEFIKKCRDNGILVSIGHSLANGEQIDKAVKAGATLSTHLGNGIPLMLPRHPNLLWEQLAQEELSASLIADGFHLPNSFLKVALKVKGDKALLVSDATCFSGMEPGEYKTHIGGEVVLSKEGRLSMKNSDGLLAGAAKSLLENIQYLVDQQLVPLNRAWELASVSPAKFLGMDDGGLAVGQAADLVIFDQTKTGKIQIKSVIKSGEVVFGQHL